MLLMLTDFTTV